MSNNLFISYDLYAPGQNYDAVITAIKALGNWAKIHKSFWYVRSNLSAELALAKVWAVMDRNDSLMVVDSTHDSAAWRNVSDEVSKYVRQQWLSQTT